MVSNADPGIAMFCYLLTIISSPIWVLLEDRGAQAPLILAPAEGFRGPSASSLGPLAPY